MAYGPHKVGSEGFVLTEVDRHIDIVDGLMVRALGTSLVEQAVAVVQAQGSVVLGDIGCGTGNTLSSWRQRVVERSGCTYEAVSGVGVSREDYAPFRDGVNAAAWAIPGLDYVVTGIEQGLDTIPDNHADVLVAYASVFYWKHPERSFKELRRIAKPGATLLLNTWPPLYKATPPLRRRLKHIMEIMEDWQNEGLSVTAQGAIINCGGESGVQVFYEVLFPENPINPQREPAELTSDIPL